MAGKLPAVGFVLRSGLLSGLMFRGVDSNHRPSGYESDELPLLYPEI